MLRRFQQLMATITKVKSESGWKAPVFHRFAKALIQLPIDRHVLRAVGPKVRIGHVDVPEDRRRLGAAKRIRPILTWVLFQEDVP